MSQIRCSSCGTVAITDLVRAGDGCYACKTGVMSAYPDPPLPKLDEVYPPTPGGLKFGAKTKIIPPTTPVEKVDHPPHYGGGDNPYEAIKVIEAWKLGFNLGNTVKYISRAHHKEDRLCDLKKARWYLDREISNMEKPNA